MEKKKPTLDLGGLGRLGRCDLFNRVFCLYDDYITKRAPFPERGDKKMTSNLAEKLDAARHHILFQHNPRNTDGYITIAKKCIQTGRFTQSFFKPDDLADHLTQVMGEDVFFSQNTFYRKARRIETVRQLRSLYVDLDFYIFNYAPEQILYWLEQDFFRTAIPEPNLIIFSGQGIVLIWTIEPAPYLALPLWQAIQNYLINQLKPLGGDPKAADAARIFRLAGSTSSKNGNEVRVQYRHDYQYTLREIQNDYLPELKPKEKRAKPGRKKKIVHLFNLYTLHAARLQDLDTLVRIRNGEMPQCREFALFLYRYWSCCFENDPRTALSHTLEFNRTFAQPLPEREAVKATESAQKAYLAKSDKEANERAKAMGYPGAGYRISNAKLITWLGITELEQQSLKTIIGTKEKNRRKRLAYHANPEAKKQAVTEYRRKKGIRPMEEYNQARKTKKEHNMEILKKAMEENPKASIRKLAQITGISKTHVGELKKELCL